MASRYSLVDQDGNLFAIDDGSFKLLEDSASIDVDIVERSFRSGADFPGIQRDASKQLIFQYNLDRRNDIAFRAYYNELTMWFRKTRYIRDTISNIETEALYQERSITYDDGGQFRGAMTSETFVQLRPYWEDVDYQLVEESGVTGEQIVINNDGYVDTPALFTIQALEQTTNYSIRIVETSEGIIVKDLQFGTEGLDTYIIDMKDGTIELNGIPRNQKIVSGTGFFNLQIGINTLEILSNGLIEVTIQYKRRYYI